MSASTQTPEQRELALVGKVEMRIALADSDSKLATTLKTYLTALLLKLASEHASVRNKVVSICQHITTRVRPQSIQLPVAALVSQFKDQQNSLIRHFDLLYIQQGVTRLSSAERAQLLPVVVSGIPKSGTHGPQIFNLLLRLLEAFPLPLRGTKEDLELRSKLEVSDDDASFLASHIGNFVLFTPQKGTSSTCPGLSGDEYAFFTLQGKEDVWNPAAGGLNLLRMKTLAARLLASGLFNDQERFLPALFAAADPASSISDVGEDILKRALPANDLEDRALIGTLFELYFGKEGTPRVRVPLRLRILALLNKSTVSTEFATNISKLVDDGVKSPSHDGEDIIMSNAPTQSGSVGREASKLRTAIFTYVNFVARSGSKDTLHSIAARVISRLRDFIDNQGWPKPGANEDLVSRGYTYEVIGLLAKAGSPEIVVESEHPSLDLLRWLLESLARDSSGNSITVSIEESLSTVLGAMSRLELRQNEQEALEHLLIDQMASSADLEGARIRSTRYVAVRFANRCLPYTSVKARWIDTLAMGAMSDRPEVREEGERGLSPYWYRMLNGSTLDSEKVAIAFPSFPAVVEQFFGQTQITSQNPEVLVRRTRELNESSFPHITAFVRRTIVQQAFRKADIPVNLDSDWERRLDALVESDVAARGAVKSEFKATMQDSPQLLDVLLCALFEAISSKTSFSEGHLVECLALAPDDLIENHVSRATSLLPALKSNNHLRRMTAGHAFGILASHKGAGKQCNSAVDQLLSTTHGWSTATGTSLSAVHGAVVALGFYFSRLAYRNQQLAESEAFTGFLATVFGIFTDSRDDLLQEASIFAIGQLCIFQALTPELLERHTKLRAVADKLYEKSKSGNEIAILSLGQLSMVLPEGDGTKDDELQHIQTHLHKLHEIKQSEVHFTVGEAFSYLACGWQSAALETKLDIEGERSTRPIRTKTLETLVTATLSDCSNTKPALRKAAVMWLLCLVQFCGTMPALQGRLSECQTAFRRCLSDRDELVQESASRGLGLVYEKGDRKIKDDLVRELVSSFSSDKQQLAGNVSSETQLFEPGALPTGDGSVSTYKDIMSLAAEVGDSSLVYRFMSMASSNAIWSSRAAFGRFGLSRVLSDSSVDGYLANNPKLYPKLFRYRFDPNGGVQRSMNEIWNTLVPDSTATIDKHFDAIIEDLLTSILGKEWRVRQACCAAIADLVSGRPFEKYEKYIERIWTQCFKVLDDIKESVRAAAASLARTLTGVLTRTLESDHSSTKNASAMLKHVLPFLLSPSGMESSAQDVQTFSVHTLLEIIKKANGSTIRSFIPELVERLIGLLSSLEPEAVNYIHLNASKYNLTEQKIDDMRLSSVRSSPLMEAIERCLDLLDDDTMRALQPKLESAMKNAVGLPSKVGCSRVLVSLSTRRMILFKPYADDALRLIEKLVIDRNDTVSSSYAVAVGYVARGASDKQILRLVNFAKKLYFESEGDREAAVPRRSITSAELMHGFAKCASDRFNAFAASTLPFVFVGKHDSNDQVKEQFQDTWNESVGGSRTVQLYLTEILDICITHLDSPQWTLKHTAARTVADAVISAASNEVQMSAATASSLWPALEKAIGGKTWAGKEVVLPAFVKYAEAAKPHYLKNKAVSSAIVKIAIREAKRQNVEYQQHSVKALAQVALARTDVDLSDAIFDAVEPILHESPDEDAMEIDGHDEASRKRESLALHAAAVEALFASINPAVPQGNTAISRVFHVVAAFPSQQNPAFWRSTYSSLAVMSDRTRKHDGAALLKEDAVRELKTLLFEGPAIAIEAIRLIRADAITALVKASPAVAEQLRADVEALVRDEVSNVVRDRLRSVYATQH